MGKLIFRAFQCEMELDYITLSRLLLVPVAKGLKVLRIGFSEFIRIHPGCSIAFCCLCIRLQNILRKWFVITVLTLPTHLMQPHRILY